MRGDSSPALALVGLLSLCCAGVLLCATAYAGGLPLPLTALLWLVGLGVLGVACWATTEVVA